MRDKLAKLIFKEIPYNYDGQYYVAENIADTIIAHLEIDTEKVATMLWEYLKETPLESHLHGKVDCYDIAQTLTREGIWKLKPMKEANDEARKY